MIINNKRKQQHHHANIRHTAVVLHCFPLFFLCKHAFNGHSLTIFCIISRVKRYSKKCSDQVQLTSHNRAFFQSLSSAQRFFLLALNSLQFHQLLCQINKQMLFIFLFGVWRESCHLSLSHTASVLRDD